MDFKIEITCHDCKCKFQLRPINFANKESLSCPNCGKGIDQDVFQHLQTGVKELALVPDEFPENSSVFSCGEDAVQFTFKVKEYDPLTRFTGKN